MNKIHPVVLKLKHTPREIWLPTLLFLRICNKEHIMQTLQLTPRQHAPRKKTADHQ